MLRFFPSNVLWIFCIVFFLRFSMPATAFPWRESRDVRVIRSRGKAAATWRTRIATRGFESRRRSYTRKRSVSGWIYQVEKLKLSPVRHALSFKRVTRRFFFSLSKKKKTAATVIVDISHFGKVTSREFSTRPAPCTRRGEIFHVSLGHCTCCPAREREYRSLFKYQSTANLRGRPRSLKFSQERNARLDENILRTRSSSK